MSSPKPFLRRGSRKEPSALNRRITSPSLHRDYGEEDAPTSAREQHRDRVPAKKFSVDSRFAAAHASLDDGCEDDGADILLSGSDYWRLDASITNGKQPLLHAASVRNPVAHHQHQQRLETNFDPMAETMNETGEWSSMRRGASDGEELDEFAMLERQLEDMSNTTLPRPHPQAHSQSSMRPLSAFAQTSHDPQSMHRESYSNHSNRSGGSASLAATMQHAERPSSNRLQQSYRGHEEEEEDDEKSFVGSTSSTAYLNSSRRLDNPFLASNGTDMLDRTRADASIRVDSSLSWGAVTRPKFEDNDLRGHDYDQDDRDQDDRDQEAEEHNISTVSRNTRHSTNSAFPVGGREREREREDTGDRDVSSSSNQHLDPRITRSRPVLPRREDMREQPNSSNNNNSSSNNNRNRNRSVSRERGERGSDKKPPTVKASVAMSAVSSSAGEDTEELRRYLNGKAKELEAELSTYRQENATLKKLRKEQEGMLAEKRAEVHKWAVEERQKTETWCEEQKQAAGRERSASLRLARDSRLSALGGTGTLGVRKERAEIEALQATLEKLKMDHDLKERKWRLAEKRLLQLAKDNSSSTEDLQQQIAAMELNKQAIWNYLDTIGVRLPGSLIRAMDRKKELGGTTGGPKSIPVFGSTSASKDISSSSKGGPRNMYSKTGMSKTVVGTYAVEVDPEQLEVGASRKYQASQRGERGDAFAATTGTGAGARGALADAIFKRNSLNDTSRGYDDDGDDDQAEEYAGSNFRPAKLSGDYEQRYPSGDPSASQHIASRSSPQLPSRGSKNVLGIDSDLKASWARSSRSSRGSRYSSDDNGQLSDDEFPVGRASDKGEFADTVKATHSGSDRYPEKSSARMGGNDTASKATAAADTSTSSNVGGNAGGSSRTEELLPDGRRLISYRNGTRKELLPSGESLVRFANGDSKTTGAGNEGVVVYYYAQADTTHTTYKDGLEVYEFPNHQVEKHFPNGTKEILFPDSTRKVIYPDGVQESFFPDGVIVREQVDGAREISRAAP